jgi:hypothetical protein
MNLRTTLTAFGLISALALGVAGRAVAEEKHENLKVLEDTGKKLDTGMKAFSKGIGVKCNACHEKGKFAADTVPAKEEARKFFTATVGEKDQAKRDAALKTLLDAMKLKEAKGAADVWEGVNSFKKKAG